MKSIDKILLELEKFNPLERDSDGSIRRKKIRSSHDNSSANEVFNFFYSKYLTGKNIFDLEVNIIYINI